MRRTTALLVGTGWSARELVIIVRSMRRDGFDCVWVSDLGSLGNASRSRLVALTLIHKWNGAACD